MANLLQVRISEQLILEAGAWEGADEKQEPYRLILPPSKSMYQQIIDFLLDVTKDEKNPPKKALNFQEATLATIAVCFRWGSYFSVLADRELPTWSANADGKLSCIGDSEMARINLEISSAFCHWLRLIYTDPALFRKLVKAAVAIFPPFFPINFNLEEYRKHFRLHTFFNSKGGRQELMAALQRDLGDAYLQNEKTRLSSNLLRAVANGVVNEVYRNGPIEDIHAGEGKYLPRPLTQRRISAFAEYKVVGTTANRLFPILHALYQILTKETGETLDEKLFPYAILFKPPYNWSLIEDTREVELPDYEPVD